MPTGYSEDLGGTLEWDPPEDDRLAASRRSFSRAKAGAVELVLKSGSLWTSSIMSSEVQASGSLRQASFVFGLAEGGLMLGA